jgi:hypothetical protein
MIMKEMRLVGRGGKEGPVLSLRDLGVHSPTWDHVYVDFETVHFLKQAKKQRTKCSEVDFIPRIL